MKNGIPSHLFLDIWSQKLSSCYESLSDWLTTTIFVNPWKNQKYLFIINLLTSLLQMKLFLRNNIAKMCAVKESISCTIFFLRLCGCVQKQPFAEPPESTCCYEFQQRSSILVRVQIAGLQCWWKWSCLWVFFNNFNYFIGNLS